MQILSDLHLELRQGFPRIKRIANNLFMAGDIGSIQKPNYRGFMDYVSETWENAFYVTGNHEYYSDDKNKEELDEEYEKFFEGYKNIHFMNNRVKMHQGVRIIGATLWSSPIEKGPFNDFIRISSEGNKTLPIKAWNIYDVAYLRKELETPHTPTVVMTHFMPLSPRDVPGNPYKSTPITDSYFGNELNDLIEKTDVWVSGHTHQVISIEVGNTRWLSNAYGYPGEEDYIEYRNEAYNLKLEN